MNVNKLIENKLKQHNRILIAIDGQCGSGKTTLAESIRQEFDALVIHMDDYFLPPEMKTNDRLNEPGGNVHYERIKQEVFEHLQTDQITIQKFNCSTNQLEEPIKLGLKNVVIIEGSYSLHRELRMFYDSKIFLKIDEETQLERIKKRSNEYLYQRFVKEWIPLENTYFKEENIESFADYIIENS